MVSGFYFLLFIFDFLLPYSYTAAQEKLLLP